MNETLAQLLLALIYVLIFAIIARSLMSWFPTAPGNPLVNFLFAVTEPVLAPLRRIIPRFGMLDLTPTVAIFVLIGLSHLVSASIG